MPVPVHLCRRSSHIFQSKQRLFRAVLLNKAQNGVQDNDSDNSDGIVIFPDKGGYCGGDYEYHHHNVPKLPHKYFQRLCFFLRRGGVCTVFLHKLRRLRGGQPYFRRFRFRHGGAFAVIFFKNALRHSSLSFAFLMLIMLV